MLLRNSFQSLLACAKCARSGPISQEASTSGLPSLLSAFSHLSIQSGTSSNLQGLASSSSRPFLLVNAQQRRARTSLTPRRSKYRKAFKGRVAVRTGGSTAGSTLEHGDYGLRVKDRPSRLTAKQLHSAHEALRRGIKVVKGAKVFMRVFPDIPVCIKGNETRMGKGKGTFEYWACRAPIGKVIFEVGGGGIAEQVAKDALRLASAKLPVLTEFITRDASPRLGNTLVNAHLPSANPSSLPKTTPTTVPVEAVAQTSAVPTA